ncbi:UDP-N-acetylglucosamine 2-epimerase [Candidatus Pelagibacter sp.]|jgi:UDP-hydrolysing UDP-N-acetyl-D-glucosamine 2-epimerase|nr:UDP-N-acetylglucosamine 2-epimerase [Candidatus Pelagibacter sp.]
MTKKIMVVINNRANYSRIRSVLVELRKKNITIQLITNSAANLSKYGDLLNIIKKDKFKIHSKIYSVVEGEIPQTMTKSAGLIVLELSALLEKFKPDLVLTIADRFETLPIAIAASYMNIPIAHTQGGEQTGSIDESVRHATTKLSQIHFPSTKKSMENIIKMGEDKKNVYLTGCPSLDLIPNKIPKLDKSFFKKYRYVGNLTDYKKPYIVILQHPVTTEFKNTSKQIIETINAIKNITKQIVWLWPNVDAGSDAISKKIRTFREENNPKNISFYKNFSPVDFLRLIDNADCFLGNSSSAIREGSYLGVPSVNIGSRQSNREKSKNVIDVDYNAKKILNAVNYQIKHGKYKKDNLYGDRNAGLRIANIIKKIKKINIQKKLNY